MDDAIDPQDWFSEDMATFGDRLSAAREAASLSRKELAQRVGIKTSTLRAWEEDLSEPRANRLSMLAGLLGVSISWLLTGEGEGVSAPDEEEQAGGDVAALLTDLRTVRAQISSANDRLARIEKRLREGARS